MDVQMFLQPPIWQYVLHNNGFSNEFKKFLERNFGTGTGEHNSLLGGGCLESRGAYELGRVITSFTNRFKEFIDLRNELRYYLPPEPTQINEDDKLLEEFILFRKKQSIFIKENKHIETINLYRGINFNMNTGFDNSAINKFIKYNEHGEAFYHTNPLECWAFDIKIATDFVVPQTNCPERVYEGLVITAEINIDDIWIWHEDMFNEDQALLGPKTLMPIISFTPIPRN